MSPQSLLSISLETVLLSKRKKKCDDYGVGTAFTGICLIEKKMIAYLDQDLMGGAFDLP